jgi:hypothetical protein
MENERQTWLDSLKVGDKVGIELPRDSSITWQTLEEVGTKYKKKFFKTQNYTFDYTGLINSNYSITTMVPFDDSFKAKLIRRNCLIELKKVVWDNLTTETLKKVLDLTKTT